MNLFFINDGCDIPSCMAMRASLSLSLPLLCLGAYCSQDHKEAIFPSYLEEGLVSTVVSGFYWNSHQDGLQYAICNQVDSPLSFDDEPSEADIAPIKTLAYARFLSPSFNWNLGFRFGLGCTPYHDGWALSLLWTKFKDSASALASAAPFSGTSLLPLWSAAPSPSGSPLFVSKINAHWDLALNIVDGTLSRPFWVSQYLTISPTFGLRYTKNNQTYDIVEQGGSFLANPESESYSTYTDQIQLKNRFHGIGPIAGCDLSWHLGSGWSVTGKTSCNLSYGKFSVSEKEWLYEIALQSEPPFANPFVLSNDAAPLALQRTFRSTQPIWDTFLGLQYDQAWFRSVSVLLSLGWEFHLFFNQNQWITVNRSDIAYGWGTSSDLADSGDNVYQPRSGDLSTQGWTLSVKFSF